MALLERIAIIAFLVVEFVVRFAFVSWFSNYLLNARQNAQLLFVCHEKVFGYTIADYSVFVKVIGFAVHIVNLHICASQVSSFVKYIKNRYYEIRLWVIVQEINNFQVQNLVLQQQVQQIVVQGQNFAPQGLQLLQPLQQQLLQLQGQNVADAG